MAVYVDQPYWPYRSMIMCHIVADSHEELVEMADKIDVDKKYIQYEGTYKEHFDISNTKRKLAIKYGAIEITSKELIKKQREKKNG